jgi:hypothetical protein
LTWGGRPFKKQKENNLAFGTIVSFEQKYNPEKTKIKNSETEKMPGTIVLEPQSMVKMESSVSTMSINSLQSLDMTRSSSLVDPPDQTLAPEAVARDDFVPLNEETLTKDNFMSAFRDLDTPNTVAKQLLNTFLLPELDSLNALDYPSETDSSPESLVFAENSHVFQGPAPSPLKFAMDDLTGFETIPELFVPLPDLLLENPLYKQHYHAYIEVHSKMLCPAAPHTYTENPFTCLLPRMSLSSRTDGLLSMIISFSLCQSSTYRSEPYPKEIVGQLLSRALDDLYKRLTDPQEANSNYTLGLIMLLSCYEIICNRNNHGWRAHYYGAKQIMFSRGLLKATTSMITQRKRVKFSRRSEADLDYFFQRWFAYLDVIGSLSSSSSSFTSSKTSDIQWEGPSTTRQDRERLRDIDPLTGFDMRLLNLFSRVVNLVEKRESGGESSKDTISLPLIQESLEIKEQILKYLGETDGERDEIERTIRADPLNVLNDQLEDYSILRATNRIFGLSGVLQVYRRVLLMPNDTSLVQDVVKQITETIRFDIPANQPAAHCTFFCLFSCGCEAITQEDRELFENRVSLLEERGLLNATIAKDVMIESWSTGKYWADILAERRLDMIFV